MMVMRLFDSMYISVSDFRMHDDVSMVVGGCVLGFGRGWTRVTVETPKSYTCVYSIS